MDLPMNIDVSVTSHRIRRQTEGDVKEIGHSQIDNEYIGYCPHRINCYAY